MQEKFRLRCDINDIQLADADAVSDALGKYSYVVPYHRYHYLFTAYHELTHGGIDDETFFTYGDISSERPVFAHMPKV